ncbi:MAG: DUF998 domain-containing protein [Mycobacteriaceae bacterium]|nr:DUF998 domain-containing protein [Mycobacteriaceae bacterium]
MTGALQFFVFEFLVAGSWRGEYSYTDNFISDLGVPYCGSHGNAPCSASSVLITMSFVVMGVSFLAAAIWMRAGMRAATAPLVGSLFMGIAAAGAVVVGLVHSNVNWPLHSLGSSLFLIFGSCSLLTVGLSHNVAPRDVASFLTAPLGLLGLVAFFCYVNSWQLGLGPGGIERVSAYSVIVGFACGVSVVGRSRFARDRAVTTRTTA